MARTMKEKLHTGELYLADDPDILEEQTRCLELMYDYNHTRPSEKEKRQELLKKMLCEVGEGCHIEPPFHSNWGGHFLHFGNNVYANFNLTCVDDTHIYVGDSTLFGPNVTLAVATHPISPSLRKKCYQSNHSIHIGKNCWIGSGAIILPEVTIGDNVIIGAGSVVTKDIPSNVIAFGNPCRVIREVTKEDEEYYFHGRKINYEDL